MLFARSVLPSDMLLKGICVIFFTLSCSNFAASISEHPIVLIVSYDGFRYDYIDSKGVTPVLKSIRDKGTYTDYMNNAFITKTYPNHHSIATGLYPEVHGILGNTVFDPKYGRQLIYEYDFWHYSDDILPIWIANEKKGGGRHSGVMMWPGNDFNYSGIYPTYRKGFAWNYDWCKRVDEVIGWILNPDKPANLVMLYYEQPDDYGHKFGPDAPEFTEKLKEMDKITKYLLDRLNATGLSNHVNVFFLSDHGMENVNVKDAIDLNKFVPANKFDRYETSPICMIYPKKGEANFVYKALKNASESGYHFKVYKKDELPERWHYKDNRRTPPILVVADPPYIFTQTKEVMENEDKYRNFTVMENQIQGFHGYDNTVMNMKPFFMAVGPQIKKNYRIKPFQNVDLFSLWANMLGFPELAEKTNGSYNRVADMLQKKYEFGHMGNICGVFIGIFLTGVSSAITIFLIKNKLRFRRKVSSRRLKEESLESRQRLLDNIETEEEA